MVEVKCSNIERIESDGTLLNEEFYGKNKDIYSLVESVLNKKVLARNNDLWLMFLCWFKQGLIKQTEFHGKKGFFIQRENIPDLELPSSIFRERRIIQNKENRLIPTDEKVLKQRKIQTKELKRFYRK